MRYLLITFIPFARQADGTVMLDRLWAEDLKGLANSIGPVTIAAPQLDAAQLQAWGSGFASLNQQDGLSFIGLPARRGRFDLLHTTRLRNALRKAVDNADLVHTSNFFEPNTNLYFAHEYATKLGLKTLFVVAEDFYDMLSWEWVRTAPTGFQRWRRQRTLHRTDALVRRHVATSSLTFLHTPAAVSRYRLHAKNGIAIRQPVHEAQDVISAEQLAVRLSTASPLRIVTASRLQSLKGLDLLVRAIALLNQRGVPVKATLYGSGPQLAYLEKLVAQLNLTHCVSLPGPLSPASALREALNQADIFLMPHLTTDFGRAFFDAIAAALPVIAFRSPASQDTVRDGIDGLLVPNADPEALATAIARFQREPELLAACSKAARIRALENTRSVWNALRTGWIRELFSE